MGTEIFYHPLPLQLLPYPFFGVFFSPFFQFLIFFKSENLRFVCSVVSSFSIIPTQVSVQFNCSVVSESLRPNGMQPARLLSPSPTPGVYSNSCPLSQWCHPTISSSVVPFSSCLQSFPASGSSQMNQFFASDGQSIGVSYSASVLPMNINDWFPLGWTGWIFLLSKGLKSFPQHHNSKASALSFLYSPALTSIHDYWKNHSFD